MTTTELVAALAAAPEAAVHVRLPDGGLVPAHFHVTEVGRVRKDFIDGSNMYDAALLYKRFRQRAQLWKFGLNPDEVAEFVDQYGWKLVEQAGPDYYVHNYIGPTGRDLAASDLEWAAYCVKR